MKVILLALLCVPLVFVGGNIAYNAINSINVELPTPN
jgi:hypothetical protein